MWQPLASANVSSVIMKTSNKSQKVDRSTLAICEQSYLLDLQNCKCPAHEDVEQLHKAAAHQSWAHHNR